MNTFNIKPARKTRHPNSNRRQTKSFNHQAGTALRSARPATPPVKSPRAFDPVAYAAALEVLG